MKANGDISLSQLPVFLFRPEVEPFLYHMAKKSPIEVILYYGLYYKKNFAKRVVEMAAAHAPDEAKRFMIEGNPINKIIRESTDTTLQILVKATAKYGKKTTATTLTGIIASGAITVEKADSITNSPKAYLTALIAIRMQKNPRAEYSLERALENQSLRFVRQINDLHNEAEAKRFASINSFTAAQLYTLIVYSEEEIFTSSFNGVLKRFLTIIGRKNQAVRRHRNTTIVFEFAGTDSIAADLQRFRQCFRLVRLRRSVTLGAGVATFGATLIFSTRDIV